MRKRPDYPLRSVDNALRLIVLLRERGPLRLSEVADELEISRSTAHRLLAMLEYHGFAGQDPETRAYVPGAGRVDVRALARPALDRLCAEVEETVHLVVLHGASVEFLDSAETSRGLRVGSRVGIRMPAHCTAAGKAILAQLSTEELHRRYAGNRLERMTPRSLHSLTRLEAELAAVRERGYATNFAESEADVAAVAVAIPGDPGGDRASISVSAPITRLRPERAPRIAAAAARAAASV
jgi:IclR family transcriptional regulator, acetate operon repressor